MVHFFQASEYLEQGYFPLWLLLLLFHSLLRVHGLTLGVILAVQTGLSPLAPGQWKPFLAVYAGFFVFLNIIRPLRFGISIALSKYFERMLLFFQNRFQVNRAGAIGMLMFCVNFCGSLAIITVGIALASALSGVPVWAR